MINEQKYKSYEQFSLYFFQKIINLDKTILETQHQQPVAGQQQAVYQEFTAHQQWFIAAITNNQTYLKKNIQFIKSRDNEGNTALMYAVKYKNNELIEILKDEIKLQNNQGYTALMFAVSVNNYYATELLIKELHIVTVKKISALHIAAFYNNIDFVQKYASKLSKLVSKTGDTSLCLAISAGNLDIVKILYPYEHNIYNASKVNCLQYAAIAGKVEIVQFLLQQDSQLPTQLDISGQSALSKVFQALEKSNLINSDVLRQKMQFSYLQIIKMLINYPLPVDKRTGNTLLHWLAKFSANSLVTNNLIKQYAKSINKQGQTALMLAAQSGCDTLVTRLIEYEACLQDLKGETALMYAIKNNNVQSASILLATEAEIQDNEGNTPLIEACRHGLDDVVLSIVNSQKNIFNKNKYNCLLAAIETDQSQLIPYLGSLINYKDADENTPMHIAAINNSFISMQRLIEFKHEQINMQNKDGDTPIDLAAKYNNPESLMYLLNYNHKPCNWLLRAIISDSWKIVKLCIDGARGTLSQDSDTFTLQQQCHQQLQYQIPENEIYPQGFNCLQLAIYCRSYNSAYLLLYVPVPEDKINITPLMLIALQNCNDVPKSLLVRLIQKYSAQQLIFPYAGLKLGMTALMIACSVNEENNELIKLLLPLEGAILDAEGHDYKFYCEIGDKKLDFLN